MFTETVVLKMEIYPPAENKTVVLLFCTQRARNSDVCDEIFKLILIYHRIKR